MREKNRMEVQKTQKDDMFLSIFKEANSINYKRKTKNMKMTDNNKITFTPTRVCTNRHAIIS